MKTKSVRSSVKTPRVSAKAAGFNVLKDSDPQRDSVTVETKSESRITDERQRLKLIALQRDNLRNTIFSPATANQVQINTVGTVGGKLTVTTSDETYNTEATSVFRRWARHAGFTQGLHFNEMLAQAATLLTHNGGDFIAAFDNGQLTTAPGSGRLVFFESDQIKPISDAAFSVLYPGRDANGTPDYFQDHGLVRDKFDRIVGAFVGARRSDEDKRGKMFFADDEFIHLTLPAPADFSNSWWTFVANTWRPNQGRGVATATYAVAAIQDISDIIASEIIAGKLNSSIGLIERNSDGSENDAPSSLSDIEEITADEAAEAGLTEEELAAYNDQLKNSIKAMRSGGSAVFKDAPGRSLEAFKTERPATNTVDFVKKIEGMATTPFGFGRLFATLDPESSYIASRGAMVLARKSFEKLQKKLERSLLDWLVPHVLRFYGVRIDPSLDDNMYWSWPDMVEIDESAFQTALEKKFSNFESTLKARHGAEWRKYVDALAEETAYCAERGILHPCLRTVSGGQVETAAEEPQKTTEEQKNENAQY